MSLSPIDSGRRQLLATGATMGAIVAASPFAASATSSLRASAGCTSLERSWIPSNDFMASLPLIMDVAALPGVSIAVQEKSSPVWARAIGVANVETSAPIREDSTFEAASMSKPVFAYVVMRLVDEGALELDRPLVQYRRPDYLPPDAAIDLITARHVLCHSSGLPNWRLTPEEKLKTKFKPGTAYEYSGEGYYWLQLVVEKLTGQGIDTVMRAKLFGPAQMSHSTYAWDAQQARLAVYGYNGDDINKLPFQFNRERASLMQIIADKWGKPISAWTYEDVIRAVPEARALPEARQWPENIAKAPDAYFMLPVQMFPNVAGSLMTTPADYAKFMTLMMPRETRAPWEISETSRRTMLTPQNTLKKGAISWGLGWELDTSPGGVVFDHDGNNGQIFKTFGIGDASRQRAIVIFTNGSGGRSVYGRITRAATGLDPMNFLL
jgi:CubicO group peptidase (beta-lactamase class C family)